MIIDNTHRRWIAVTFVLFALLTASYVVYARHWPGGTEGGSLPGLAYGIGGSALMVYAGLISARKKVPRWRIGRAQTWLRGHIWLGLLSVPMILFHAGFRWGGLLEQALLAVLAGLVLTGFFGLAVQQVLTRSLTARVPRETFFDQIPHVCSVLQVEGDVTVSRVCGPLPVEPDVVVATKERLERLHVTGRDPLRAVYQQPSTEGAGPPQEAPIAKAVQAPRLREVKEPRAQPEAPPQAAPASVPENTGQSAPKALSTAEKLAAMKASKRTAPAVEKSSADLPPAEQAVTQSASSEPGTAAPNAPPKALSTAEKLALMKAGKRAAPAAEQAAARTDREDASSGPATSRTPPTKSLSTAEKLALMKAGKKAAPANSISDESAAPGAAGESLVATAAPVKAMSTAEKLALMKAGKKAAPAAATVAGDSTSAVAPIPAQAAPVATAATLAPKRVASAATVQRFDEWKRACPALTKLYLESVRTFLGRRVGSSHRLSSPSQTRQVFAEARDGLPVEMHDALDRLAELCDERRQLEMQVRIHFWLHGWLLLHVPLSLALLVLGVAHAVVSLYY